MVCCLLMHATGTSGQDATARDDFVYDDVCSQCGRPVGEGGGHVAAHVIAYPLVPCSVFGLVGLAAGGPGAAVVAGGFLCSFIGGPLGLKRLAAAAIALALEHALVYGAATSPISCSRTTLLPAGPVLGPPHHGKLNLKVEKQIPIAFQWASSAQPRQPPPCSMLLRPACQSCARSYVPSGEVLTSDDSERSGHHAS
eukprot:CAMPEP_0119408190 /NCGR_PEP_ID=MMETSP1335-20130426/1822_1 /TAXON_ID=259385 /ORGANISM="Chrysoculter rhomboideus, Strain RCC1486" /LENGTH=196 /DNA_ID=CAMNT_0007432399 /DNA_START=136 /DNA_END=727 /DNA_ORIENTATION=+